MRFTQCGYIFISFPVCPCNTPRIFFPVESHRRELIEKAARFVLSVSHEAQTSGASRAEIRRSTTSRLDSRFRIRFAVYVPPHKVRGQSC